MEEDDPSGNSENEEATYMYLSMDEPAATNNFNLKS